MSVSGGAGHLFPFEVCEHSDLVIFADVATEDVNCMDSGSWDPAFCLAAAGLHHYGISCRLFA